MGDAVRFWHRGDVVELRDVDATTTVLEWLRSTRVSMGTKEGCNEGDCGACAVVLGVPDGSGGLTLQMAHACVVLVPMLHGRALVTVEDLADGDVLHPVQQQMVDRHGSQCGFCTPGIVMSLWRMHADAQSGALAEEDVRRGLAGHVCRCTGYRSIVSAAVAAMGARPGVSKLTGAAEALDDVADDVLDYRVGDTSFLSPTTVDGLLRARRERPRARVIAGGTDVVPAVPGRGELPLEWIWTGRVAGFDAVVVDPGMLVIGGGASVEAAWAALAGRWPQLVTGWQRFASPAIRENGTLAGNLVTASPIGDSAPVLLALDARVVVSSVDGERTLPLSDFFAGYRRTALSPDEIVVRIEVPLPEPARDVRMYKVARRFDNDIATVSVAVSLLLDGDAIEQVRVAFGGMSAVPGRAGSVEQVLAGRRWDRDALVAAQEAVALDVSPMSDHRGSAEYRMSVARGLLERWWLQTRPDHPLPVTATEVWSAS